MTRTTRRVFLLFFCLVCPFVSGTVYVTDTGASFASRPATFGASFQRGYEYMSRLQYLPDNPYACPPLPPNKNYDYYNILDDLLLAGRWRQAQQQRVESRTSARRSWWDHQPSIHHNNIIIPTGWWPQETTTGGDEIVVPTDGLPVTLLVKRGGCTYQDKALFAQSLSPAVKFVLVYDDHPSHELIPMAGNSDAANTVSVRLLSVSYRSGNTLLQVLQNEAPETTKLGGTRILLDSRRGWEGDFWGHNWMWIALVFLLVSCCGSFLFLLAQDQIQHTALVNETQEARQEERRLARRRLTVEQVETELENAIYDRPPPTCDEHGGDEDEEERHVATAAEPLETCAICLDDFENGDELKLLPCEHFFHTSCVTRWLTQRSATCPLCKLHLLEDEEEEQEEEEHVELQEQVTQTDGEGAMVQTEEEEPSPSRSWWSRLWLSRDSDDALSRSVHSMMQEHLLGGDDEDSGTTPMRWRRRWMIGNRADDNEASFLSDASIQDEEEGAHDHQESERPHEYEELNDEDSSFASGDYEPSIHSEEHVDQNDTILAVWPVRPEID